MTAGRGQRRSLQRNAADSFDTSAWTGATTNTSGVSPMNQVVFTGYSASNTHWQSYDHQIAPVPESAVTGALVLTLGLAVVGYRRLRLRS